MKKYPFLIVLAYLFSIQNGFAAYTCTNQSCYDPETGIHAAQFTLTPEERSTTTFTDRVAPGGNEAIDKVNADAKVGTLQPGNNSPTPVLSANEKAVVDSVEPGTSKTVNSLNGPFTFTKNLDGTTTVVDDKGNTSFINADGTVNVGASSSGDPATTDPEVGRTPDSEYDGYSPGGDNSNIKTTNNNAASSSDTIETITTEKVPGATCVCIGATAADGKTCAGSVETRKYKCTSGKGLSGFQEVFAMIIRFVVNMVLLFGVLAIVGLGIAWSFAGGDDIKMKSTLKTWAINIIIGLIILFMFRYILLFLAPWVYQ